LFERRPVDVVFEGDFTEVFLDDGGRGLEGGREGGEGSECIAD
jgi:hypothetical protein